MANWFANNSTGNDSTGTGARSTPYSTYAKCLSVAAAGDTITLVSTGTAYDFAGTQSKELTVRGSGANVAITSASGAGASRLVVAGCRFTCWNLTLSGATNTGIAGFGVQEGGELRLYQCTSSGNGKAFTLADTSYLYTEDCNFANSNAAVSTVSSQARGEFVRTSGMPFGTVDTKGVRDRSGATHQHTLLRNSLFYAAPEFYVPGTRTVFVDLVAGIDTAEGTEAAPVRTPYCAERLPGAKTVIVVNPGGANAQSPYVFNEGASGGAYLNEGFDVEFMCRRDAYGNGIVWDFSKTHTDYALTSGATNTYERVTSTAPLVAWQNDQSGHYDKTSTWQAGAATTWQPKFGLDTDFLPAWRTLTYVASQALVETTEGSCYYDTGTTKFYAHPYGSGSPNSRVQLPTGTNPFYVKGGRLKLSGFTVRGGGGSAVASHGGRVELDHVYILANGNDGTDVIHSGGSIDAKDSRSEGNGTFQGASHLGDGAGLHQGTRGTWTRCVHAGNNGDGFSPHDGSVMSLIDCRAYHNGSRGVVAVAGLAYGTRMEVTRGAFHDNGGGNVSYEDAQTNGFMDSVLSHSPASGQPNVNVQGGAALDYYRSVRDNTGAIVTANAISGSTVKTDLNDRDAVVRAVSNA